MQTTITIHLSQKAKTALHKRAKSAGISLNKFILLLIENESPMTNEDELYEEISQSMIEHKSGKTKILRSLKELV